MKDLSHRRISPKELAAKGWTRTNESRSCHRAFKHRDGWTLSHCGHPTALWPYMLVDPSGKTILTGAWFSGRADFGTAWPSIAAAVDYVFEKRPTAKEALAQFNADTEAHKLAECYVCGRVIGESVYLESPGIGVRHYDPAAPGAILACRETTPEAL